MLLILVIVLDMWRFSNYIPYLFVLYISLLVFFFFYKQYVDANMIVYILSSVIFFSLYYYTFYGYLVIFRQREFLVETKSLTHNLGTINYSFSLKLDRLSFFFTFLILIIGLSTNIYTLNYFKNEADESSFLFWLNFFILSMIILVLANNFFTLFLGWELIGLTSFFLINFWSSRRATLKSSFKAFSFNLVSDLTLLTGLVLLFRTYQTDSISLIITLVKLKTYTSYDSVFLATIMLIICSSIKSVQIIGHLWLPDSMEAPVPASSLIHSATLVSAGIYLLLRFNILLTYNNLNHVVITIGSITAAYGAITAAAQTDVKKLLAYSTMSHSGFLFILTGLGDFYITIVYLFLHGIFKAATFFCVGSFIRLYGTQDTRLMGSASSLYQLDSFFLILCALNLCGLPFSIGFLYKFFFLKILTQSFVGILNIGFIFIGMLSSVVYFYRLIFYCVFDINKSQTTAMVTSLQVNNFKLKRDMRFATFSQLTAMQIIYFFSFFIYFYIIYILIDTINVHTIIPGTNLITPELYKLSSNLFKTYIIIFYFFYLFILLLLMLISWRDSFIYTQTLIFLTFLLISTIFLYKVWGSILTEANTLTNFNYGFSTHKSDILIHLSQWQYWWWFWFSLFWTVYFFLIIRILNKRTTAFNPLLNTSLRSHGKWGDFLVALIPLSWCGNILVNSNFILRMIEWQNESSLFTIRVQGKQWYWVYKYDANAAQLIFSAPKNIGHNKWFMTIPGESYTSDNYYQILQLGTQLEYRKLYLKYLNDEGRTNKNISENSLSGNSEIISKNSINIIDSEIVFKKINSFNNKEILFNKLPKNLKNSKINLTFTKKISFDKVGRRLNLQYLVNSYNPLDFIRNSITNKYSSYLMAKDVVNSYYDFDLVDDLFNYAANTASETNLHAVKFLRGILNKHNINLLTSKNMVKKLSSNNTDSINRFNDLYKNIKSFKNNFPVSWNILELFEAASNKGDFKVNSIKVLETKLIPYKQVIEKKVNFFFESALATKLNKPVFLNVIFNSNLGITDKPENNELLWGFKQKKYKRFQKFFFNEGVEYDSKTLNPIAKKEVWRLKNGLVLNLKLKKGSEMVYHRSVKYNRHRAEIVPVNLARRLLRVKRTLVLPAHVNITLISNSYDVVHSWFIPGLGLKIDCVPGRSTHHTFYIDNVGFYYGQCAEICGRYHHHMPIRLCALSFEHFLVWWQKKGLKRVKRLVMLREKTSNFRSTNYASGLN